MSWSGTVYCRYCGNKGHNSRTCPQKTEHYRLRAQAEVDNGEAREGYWHREYAKRTGKWARGTGTTRARVSDVVRSGRCAGSAEIALLGHENGELLILGVGHEPAGQGLEISLVQILHLHGWLLLLLLGGRNSCWQ